MKDKSIEILEHNRCSGCNACFSACPTNAIEMKYNEEGFLYPIVDHDKCTNCGLCSQICPEISFNFNNYKIPECYAMQATDEIRKSSTSGGMFTILSDYILEQGGYVCGAAFNESWEVEHIIINNKKDLEKLRGSKYIQSNKNNVFKEIKELLNNDKLVLFSGCPCEIAGLKKYLKKDYNNLILIDLICAGIMPPLMWNKYLYETFTEDKIKNITFRDKNSYGWGLQLNIYYENGNSYRKPEWENIFCKLFSKHSISRRC